MYLTVEFFGVARELTKARQIELELPPESSLRDVVAALAKRCPKLAGPVIDQSATGLVASYLFNLDGRHSTQDLDFRPQDGQHILLLFAQGGG